MVVFVAIELNISDQNHRSIDRWQHDRSQYECIQDILEENRNQKNRELRKIVLEKFPRR